MMMTSLEWVVVASGQERGGNGEGFFWQHHAYVGNPIPFLFKNGFRIAQPFLLDRNRSERVYRGEEEESRLAGLVGWGCD